MFPGLQSWKTWPTARPPKHVLNPGIPVDPAGSSGHIWGMKKWHLWGSPWLTFESISISAWKGLEFFVSEGMLVGFPMLALA